MGKMSSVTDTLVLSVFSFDAALCVETSSASLSTSDGIMCLQSGIISDLASKYSAKY